MWSFEITFERQRVRKVEYKGEQVGEGRLGLLVGDRLIVEVKAVREVAPFQRAIVVSCLKATGESLALLINFKVSRLKEGVQRVVLS